MKIKGIITSSGIAMGNAFKLNRVKLDTSYKTTSDVETEINRFQDALYKSAKQLEELELKATKTLGEAESKIFYAHRLMLKDPEFIELVESCISSEGAVAPYAVEEAKKQLEQMFLAMGSDYMKERAADINDICNRVLRNIYDCENELKLPQNAVIFCDDLEPSDTASLDPKIIAGIVTSKGGETSHSAIIAKSLGIPALSGIAMVDDIINGEIVIIDALKGEVIIAPEESEIAKFNEQKEMFKNKKLNFEMEKELSGISKDGFHIEIAGNIANPKDAKNILEAGAEGIGLFRTEFLYMNRETPPTLTEQFEAYKSVLESFGDKPVVIRTFDIGGDKKIDYLGLKSELNPFLGYRAIRISLKEVELFKIQLKALMMASAYGNLKIMFPMISCVDEILSIKRLLDEVCKELDYEEIEYGKVEIGIMVEIPSVAIMARQFAEHVDFFSIGTNDLLQYTIAVDRMNEELANLYTWYHPALLRLISNVADAARAAGIWVGICGEAASDVNLLPFYLGCGINELSMSPSKIGEIKWNLRRMSREEAKAHVDNVLSLHRADEIKLYLQENYSKLIKG